MSIPSGIIEYNSKTKKVLNKNDIIVVYDENGVLPDSTCNNIKYGEVEVGFGIWKNA